MKQQSQQKSKKSSSKKKKELISFPQVQQLENEEEIQINQNQNNLLDQDQQQIVENNSENQQQENQEQNINSEQYKKTNSSSTTVLLFNKQPLESIKESSRMQSEDFLIKFDEEQQNPTQIKIDDQNNVEIIKPEEKQMTKPRMNPKSVNFNPQELPQTLIQENQQNNVPKLSENITSQPTFSQNNQNIKNNNSQQISTKKNQSKKKQNKKNMSTVININNNQNDQQYYKTGSLQINNNNNNNNVLQINNKNNNPQQQNNNQSQKSIELNEQNSYVTYNDNTNMYNLICTIDQSQNFAIYLNQPYISDNNYGILIEEILKNFAQKGELMVQWSQFENQFKISMLQRYQISDIKQIEQILQKNLDIYHQTMRKFGDSEPIFYVSLKLKLISIEAIYWILYSIRRDQMTPSEKLVFSRIKECFGLKLNQNNWNQIITFLVRIMNKKTNEIHFKQNQKLPIMKLKKSRDPLNGQEFYLVYIKNLDWITQDQGPISPDDYQNWNIFLNFLKQFFQEDNTDLWISSVVNIHTIDPKKSVVKPPKDVKRAIPGGRYGCAILLQCCGPQQLKQLSLGKLSLFVQESITKGILIYYKTLLIKGQLDNCQDQEKENQNLQKERIYKVKESILKNLKEEENKNGITLARMPKLIEKYIDFQFDIQDLGFLKLKNLLKTIEGVWIENDGTTLATAHYSDETIIIQKQLSQIQQKVQEIIQKNQLGIGGEEISIQLNQYMKCEIDYSKHGAVNLCDFLQKYCNKICEVQVNLGYNKNNFFAVPYTEKEISYHKNSSGDDFKKNIQISNSQKQSQSSNKIIDDLMQNNYPKKNSSSSNNNSNQNQNNQSFNSTNYKKSNSLQISQNQQFNQSNYLNIPNKIQNSNDIRISDQFSSIKSCNSFDSEWNINNQKNNNLNTSSFNINQKYLAQSPQKIHSTGNLDLYNNMPQQIHYKTHQSESIPSININKQYQYQNTIIENNQSCNSNQSFTSNQQEQNQNQQLYQNNLQDKQLYQQQQKNQIYQQQQYNYQKAKSTGNDIQTLQAIQNLNLKNYSNIQNQNQFENQQFINNQNQNQFFLNNQNMQQNNNFYNNNKAQNYSYKSGSAVIQPGNLQNFQNNYIPQQQVKILNIPPPGDMNFNNNNNLNNSNFNINSLDISQNLQNQQYQNNNNNQNTQDDGYQEQQDYKMELKPKDLKKKSKKKKNTTKQKPNNQDQIQNKQEIQQNNQQINNQNIQQINDQQQQQQQQQL